jgi:hypothetical protein
MELAQSPELKRFSTPYKRAITYLTLPKVWSFGRKFERMEPIIYSIHRFRKPIDSEADEIVIAHKCCCG